jgi:hypothetical protein
VCCFAEKETFCAASFLFWIRCAVLRLTYVAPRLALQLAQDPTIRVLSYGSMPVSNFYGVVGLCAGFLSAPVAGGFFLEDLGPEFFPSFGAVYRVTAHE